MIAQLTATALFFFQEINRSLSIAPQCTRVTLYFHVASDNKMFLICRMFCFCTFVARKWLSKLNVNKTARVRGRIDGLKPEYAKKKLTSRSQSVYQVLASG